MHFHEIPLTAGVNTNFDPETQTLKTLRTGQNVDTYRKFRALGKVPGSTKITSGGAMPAAVKSIHQFEYTSLSAVRTRKQLAASNGALYDFTGGTATSIWSSPALYVEPLCDATFGNRIYLSSENQRKLPTGGIKYDGDNVRRWGVLAPGTEPTVVNALDSHTGWTDSTDATTSTEATNTRDGAGSVSLAKDGTTVTTAYFEKASLAITFSTSVQAYVWVYLPPGTLQKLATSGTALEVRMGGASLTDSDKHAFSVGELVPGWNLLSLALDAPDSETGTGAVLTAIDTVRFTVNTVQTSTTFSGLLWDNLYRVDLGKPTAAVNAAGNIDDTVTYRVTFLTEFGVESNAGSASNSIVPVSAAATQTLTIGTLPLDATTVTIGTIVYTFKTTLTPTAYQVLLGGSIANACENLAFAINATGDAGTDYAAGIGAHSQVTATNTATTVVITARDVGTGGNSIVTTETLADGSWAAATMSGGRAGQSVSLTAVPVSSDSQVIARRIYRDSQADRVYRFVDQIDDNVTTTYADDTASGSLGNATMPIAGDDQLDSSPPERMRSFTIHENRIFGISGDDASIIIVSDVSAPEQYRIIDQLSVDEELVGLESHPLGGLVLYGRKRTLLLTGNGVDTPFRVDALNAELGANSWQAITDVLGVHMVQRAEEVYLVADPREPWLLNGPVLDQFAAASSSQLEAAFTVHDRVRFRILFFIGSAIWVYQYATVGTQEITGEGPGVGPKDLRVGAWFTITLPVTASAARLVEESANKPEVWIGATDGHVYQVQDTSALSYATASSTAAIDADFETHALPIGPPSDNGAVAAGDAVNGRGVPRYLLVNSFSTTGITWAATVTVLSDSDGVSIGTSTFNVLCPAGSSTVIVPVPPAYEVGGWCRIRLRNNTSTEDGYIKGLRLFYVPRGSFRGVRAS
jgi:hypothetical protein